VRTNGIPERAKVWASEQSPEFAPLLRAFVTGLNAWGTGVRARLAAQQLALVFWGDRHTYFEVQLQAPGVTSYGAVWVGFPTLRQCFTDWLGWTQRRTPPMRQICIGYTKRRNV
jgi:acyl-homoserine lactone acylase PvdQ